MKKHKAYFHYIGRNATQSLPTVILYSLVLITFTVLISCQADDSVSPGTSISSKSADATAGFSGNGVNLQPSYYNGGNVNFGWSLMKSYGKIKTVRIEIDPSMAYQAKSWIKQARDNGYQVIATYHKWQANGSDDENELLAAANWWKSNYSFLSQSGSFTINLMNEWGSHNKTAKDYATSYNKAISIIRGFYSGRIIIDIPGWAQETAIAASAVKGYNTGGVKINDTNIALSVHIYPSAWNQAKNRWLANADLDDLASAGRPCIVGEFGAQGSGSANWSGLVDYAKSKGWTVMGWAWNGDGEGYNMVSPSWSSNPTATSFSPSSYFYTIYNKL